MPRLSYIAVDSKGTRLAGNEDVVDEDALIAKLQNQGLVVVEIKPYEETSAKKGEKIKRKSVSTHGRVRISDLVMFAQQLATMLDAGVTLMRALQVISQQIESATLSRTLDLVMKDLEKGSSFSSALYKYPKVFSQFWASLVEVGEASGTLPTILEKLSDYLEAKADFQNKIISALIYPVLLLFVAAGAVTFFAMVIIPRFAEMFKTLNVPLPFLTQKLLEFFEFIRTKFLFILFILVAIIITFKRYLNTEVGRRQSESVVLRLPAFGNFYRLLIIERFTSQMAILIGSGVPILYALEICERMVVSRKMASVIGKIKNQVREGKLIAEPMDKSGFFTPMVVQMVLIGEETGELDKMLKRVAAFYQDYVKTFVSRLSTLIEPLMLIFMGLVIGTIVIAMFMPIFSLASGAGTGNF